MGKKALKRAGNIVVSSVANPQVASRVLAGDLQGAAQVAAAKAVRKSRKAISKGVKGIVGTTAREGTKNIPASVSNTYADTAPKFGGSSLPATCKTTIEVNTAKLRYHAPNSLSHWDIFEINPTTPESGFKLAETAKNFQQFRVTDIRANFRTAKSANQAGQLVTCFSAIDPTEQFFDGAGSFTQVRDMESSLMIDFKSNSSVSARASTMMKPVKTVASTSVADDRQYNAASLIVWAEGVPFADDDLGTLTIDIKYVLEGLNRTTNGSFADLNLDVTIGPGGTFIGSDTTGSDIGLWWKRSKDGGRYYYLGPDSMFNTSAVVAINGDFDATAGTTFEFDTIGGALITPTRIDSVIAGYTNTAFTNTNFVAFEGKFFLPSKSSIRCLGTLVGTKLQVQLTPTQSSLPDTTW